MARSLRHRQVAIRVPCFMWLLAGLLLNAAPVSTSTYRCVGCEDALPRSTMHACCLPCALGTGPECLMRIGALQLHWLRPNPRRHVRTVCAASGAQLTRLLKLLFCRHRSPNSVKLLNDALAVMSNTTGGCTGNIIFAAGTNGTEFQLNTTYTIPANGARKCLCTWTSKLVLLVTFDLFHYSVGLEQSSWTLVPPRQ